MPRSELPPRGASPDVAESFDTADRWSRSRDFQRAFDVAMSDPKARAHALSDPESFLEGFGVPLPDGLRIAFLEKPPPAMPGPDFEQFSIRLFNCRTYFLPSLGGPDKPRKYEQVQICFGFEIIRNPGPRGPG